MAEQRELVTLTLAASADEAWRALRDPATIRRWFGWDYEGLDDEIRQYFLGHSEASDEDRTLTWPDTGQFAIEPAGAGTSLLRVTWAAPADGASWDDVYDDIPEGWLTFVHQLAFLLARHRDDERRTLFVGGSPRDGGPLPIAALGLAGIADQSPGSRYEADGPGGERWAGEVWFRTRRQLGLTVEAYGDGLVVLAERPEDPPSAMVVVTTYGLDDAGFAAVEDRWNAWWEAGYEPHSPV
jgi:uncharacterized protein YndB with AHSA1/START domain